MDRRHLLRLAALAPFATALGSRLRGAEPLPAPEMLADRHAHDVFGAIPDLQMHGNETIAMLLYPGFTALDLVGPHYFFGSLLGARVHLVTTGADLAPVPSDLALAIMPSTTLETCPRDVDVLFVPGGTVGTIEAMRDDRVVDFIVDRAARARHVTSVCTGALLLGQAGLLRGRRATTHWAARDTLGDFGATYVAERVVTDGPVTTGAGVSAGLDLGLVLLAALRGTNYARAIQLQAEYDPAPAFDAGTPETAPPDVHAAMAGMLAPFREMVRSAANPR